MARVKARVETMERDIALLLPEAVDERAVSKVIADYARSALSDAQEQNRQVLGRVPPHTQFVDGKEGASLEDAQTRSTIVFEFKLEEEMFNYIHEMLIEHSPVGQSGDSRPGHPGLYRRSHVFLADGVAVEPGERAPIAAEYTFLNVQPYARKIERGLSRQAPDGVYDVVATLASRRFGNLARIRFGYRTPLFGAIDAWAETTPMASKSKGARREEWLRRQPAIIITLR